MSIFELREFLRIHINKMKGTYRYFIPFTYIHTIFANKQNESKFRFTKILTSSMPPRLASTLNINRKFMCWYQFSVAWWVIAEGCYNNQRYLHFVRSSCNSPYECMCVPTTCHSAAMALSHILMYYFCRCEGPSSTRNVLIAAPQR